MPRTSFLRIAVVGGGAAGCTAAVLLAAAGHRVTLLEARVTTDAGSGVMLQSNALRVLRGAGVLDAVEAAGYGFDSTGIRLPDARASLVGELPLGRADAELPGAVGIARSRLTGILHQRALEVGVTVRLGAEVTAVATRGAEVDVEVRAGDDRSSEAHDLLVAADGVGSSVRTMIGIDVAPRQLPLGVWRVTTPRPPTVVRTEIINGGPAYFAGYAPTSEDSMYAWLVDDYTDRRGLTRAERIDVVRRLAAGYHGPWDDIRASLTPDTPLNYTRYSALLLPPPWHRGRVVLIGDAVHACPPTMAQGAALALEDSAVLAEMVISAHQTAVQPLDDRTLDELLTAYAARRLPRVRAVVDGSVQMVEWQVSREEGGFAGLITRTSDLLAAPA